MKRSGAPRRRTPVRPSTKPLKRSEPSRARTRIRSRKADPTKRRFAKLRNAAFQEWVREQPCLLIRHPWSHNCWGSVQCCHVKARSTGGADIGNCVPMCASAHALQHLFGMKSFQKTFGLDLAKLAAEYGGRYTRERDA